MTKTIMIVDDNPEILTLCGVMFQRKGYTVLKADDGVAALTLLDDSIPDLFILDVMMPEINGIELCKRIRAMPQHVHTPILFLSAYSDSGIVGEGFAAGGNDYIIKPINPRDFQAKVADLIHQTEA